MSIDLRGLEKYPRFILWKMDGDKKRTIDWRTGFWCDFTDPQYHMSAANAFETAERWNATPGFVICREDPLFFIDIDDGLDEDGLWRDECLDVVNRFPGAFVEISQSGTGMHIIASCDKSKLPANRRCKAFKFDTSFDAMFTEKRFVALTMEGGGRADKWMTDEAVVFTGERLVTDGENRDVDWTDEPIEGDGLSDTDIIDKALAAESTAGSFGYSVRFVDLWEANAEVIGQHWPDDHRDRIYDASRADAALAQHLAFWTGGNCEQMERLMRMSALMRDKWDAREDYYLPRTILRAVSRQSNFYKRQMNSDGKTGETLSDAVRAAVAVEEPRGHAADRLALASSSASDAVNVPPPPKSELASAALRLVMPPPPEDEHGEMNAEGDSGHPIPPPPEPVAYSLPEARLIEGSRFMSAREQLKYFDGCIYITSVNRVLTSGGELIRPEAFKAYYGGFRFELDGHGKSTTNAFTAFTESQLVSFPRAMDMIFRPTLPAQAIVDGCVNTYRDCGVVAAEGDVGLFLAHMEKLLPVEADREILLDYMAACVQRPGDKFQWCPLLQGCEGNGKSLIGTVLRNAIGRRYFHQQDPEDLGNMFNSWIERSIVVCVEEIFVNSRYEMSNRMKAMITNEYMPVHAKGQDQRSASNCAKFILFSNHKDGVHKHADDRRYAVFYTAQQRQEDKRRDGMTGGYFRKLYQRINSIEGMAAINWYLRNRVISTDMMGEAPETSSTGEAIYESYGPAERVVLEAIENEEIGLRGGVLSATYVDYILREAGYRKVNPKLRVSILKNINYKPAGRIRIDDKRHRIYIPNNSIHENLSTTELKKVYLKHNHSCPG